MFMSDNFFLMNSTCYLLAVNIFQIIKNYNIFFDYFVKYQFLNSIHNKYENLTKKASTYSLTFQYISNKIKKK